MDLREAAIKGIKWTASGAIVTTGILFFQNIILARLLTPEDFGLMAIVLVGLGFLQPFFDLGLSAAVIQKQDIRTEQLSSLYWLNALLGLICFLITLVSAPLASYFFEEKDLTNLIRVAGIGFLINGCSVQYGALIMKKFMFSIQNGIRIVASMLTLIFAVTLALLGQGVWTLVYAYLFQILISSTLNIYFGRQFHIPTFYFNMGEIKELLSFGLFEAGNRTVNFFSANVDKIIIGRLLGPDALGLYTIAWNLVMQPLRRINPIVNNVTFPLFSKLQHAPDKVSKYYRESILLLMLITVPIIVMLSLGSEDVLNVLYGPQWHSASSALSILAFVGLLKSFANPGGALILASGRADIGFYWNTGWSIFLVGVLLGATWLEGSLFMIAIGQLAAGLLAAPVWHCLVYRSSGVNYRTILHQILLLVPGAISIILVFMTIYNLNILASSAWLRLGISVTIASVLYVLVSYRFSKERFVMLKKILY